ncbi:MAG: hypothetical protein HY290_10620 [Planctomycetia bacterium]|nr:hypothetical protein [Planctomycetia bacterium]
MRPIVPGRIQEFRTPKMKTHSQTAAVPQQRVTAGVFSDLATADRAVSGLLQTGFTPAQITVICSDEAREQHFRKFEHQEPAGAHAGMGSAAGAGIGAAIGGLAAIAVGAASGAVPLVIAGAAGIAAGSGAGAFVGAMTTRGDEKEVSNFYDQAVREGQILVSVEDHGPGHEARLARAAKVIADAGAKPIPLPEG